MSEQLLDARAAATEPGEYWAGMTEAVADIPAPVAAVNLGALRQNALDLVLRARGVPIRVASKSVRVRQVLDAVQQIPGYRGILAFTLAEALWLARDHDDIVLGYPTVDQAALRALLGDEDACQKITLMVDDPAHLDLIDQIEPASSRPTLRVALDVDASWRRPGFGHVGVRRSPLHHTAEVVPVARQISERAGFRLVGLMMYEAQIAGQPDAVGAGDIPIHWMKRRSGEELIERRASVTRRLREITDLEFVNGGGTGSLELTASDQSVTEVTAGSGLFAGHLFDGYRTFTPAPAAAFALDVVRKPAADIVTVHGGGWIASGPPSASRQPQPVWPPGLRTLAREGAGEVQTPLRGPAARELAVGDRVWFRHAKSGEFAERVNEVQLVDSDRVVTAAASYRGEGMTFL